MLTTLGQFTDALYLSARYELPDHIRELLGAAKIQAQETDEGLELLGSMPGVPGGPVYVKRHGRGKYQYVLENADLYCEVSTWANMPTVQVQFKAHFLYEHSLTNCESVVKALLRALGAPEGVEPKPTRFDLAVDFQPPDEWTPPDMADVVTRAKSRYVNWRSANEVNAVTLGERSGALQVQIYNKSNELLSSGKTWMYDVWRKSGNYREGVPVWRVELRFFRVGLHQFDINTIRELSAGIGDLAAYSVGSESPWLRIADPSTRHYAGTHHADRRTSAPWWGSISAALRSGLSSAGRKRRRPRCRSSFSRSLKMAGCYLSKLSALGRVSGMSDHLTPKDVGKWVGEMVGDELNSRGRSWPEVVNDRMRALRLEYAAV